MVQALDAVRSACDAHTITRGLDRQVLAAWQAWARLRVQVLTRASSVVEGHNNYVSHMPRNQRGLSKQRYKVWVLLYNFDYRAPDGITPAARFFGRAFLDLIAEEHLFHAWAIVIFYTLRDIA
jgi:hypothetical protein